MKNLAGDADCDGTIRSELMRCRIPIVEGDRSTGEVPFTVTGKLGAFEFHRAWYYWVVKGPVPLEVARELYADPVGKTDVRVDGHCACPAPVYPWVACYDVDGKRISLDPDGKDRKAYEGFIEKGHLDRALFEKIRWVGSPEEYDAVTVRALVETYHIDTEVGLRLFVDTLRAKGLVG